MAIPNKPLELKPIDPKDLTIGEMALIQGTDFQASDFIEFLSRYTNWGKAEIRRITLKELEEVAKQLNTAFEALTVPKVS